MLNVRDIEESHRFWTDLSGFHHLTDPNGYQIELVFELPRALWERNIDAALNHAVERPITE